MKIAPLFLRLFALSLIVSTVYAAEASSPIPTNKITSPSAMKVEKKVSSKPEMVATINRLFQWVNQNEKSSSPASRREFDQFFTPNVEYVVNGKQIANNTQSLFSHFEYLKSTRMSYSVILPVQKILVEGNEVALMYKVDIQHKTGERSAESIAIIKFDHGKITSWRCIDSYPQLEKPRQMS